MLRKLEEVLIKKGSSECLKKLESLEKEISLNGLLNLRKLDLEENELVSIANILEQEKGSSNSQLKSISLSYNPLVGNVGASLLLKSLPSSVREIGLVGCGIGDNGGIALLKWMEEATDLQMICVEQNNFSKDLRINFKKFRSNNPQVLFVF
ncbi:MAG: hypothetical protein ACI84C_002846 [Flavobacteriales bacterium]|jgi:hypothetical protein